MDHQRVKTLPLPPNVPSFEAKFEGRDNVHGAIQSIIGEAHDEIILVDQTGAGLRLDDINICAGLSAFTRGGRQRRIKLLIRDETFLVSQAARFDKFRRICGPSLEARRYQGSETQFWRYVVSDQRHWINVAPSRLVRGSLQMDAAEPIAAWWQAAQAIWQEAQPCLPSTTLGL
jgi:hypothetical protein